MSNHWESVMGQLAEAKGDTPPNKEVNVVFKMKGKLIAGVKIIDDVKARLVYTKSGIEIHSGYNKALLAEVKSMAGARYLGFSGGPKAWIVTDNQHNDFQIRYLQGENVYARYDCPLIPVPEARLPRFNRVLGREVTPYAHQIDFVDHIYTRRGCIVAGEMGTGKTLGAIIAMEKIVAENGINPGTTLVPSDDIIYVAPKSVLQTVKRELWSWDCKVYPRLLTPDGLIKLAKAWPDGKLAPRILVLDEASMFKTPTSQRSQAAKAFADGMRKDWGNGCWVIDMTGTPAPKSPEDWFMLASIACPGFIKEGDPSKFKARLAVVKLMDSPQTGGKYPKLLGWKDDVNKCNICAAPKDAPIHELGWQADSHVFEPSINEIDNLYKRMQGLVMIKMKKYCLDLPDKIYRLVELKPTRSILRTADAVLRGAGSTIEGLTRLRELSDGFQYNEEKTGEEVCTECHGEGEAITHIEIPGTCPNCPRNDAGEAMTDDCIQHNPKYTKAQGTCPKCGGRKMTSVFSRTVLRTATPKDDALIELLEENDDIGRIVVFAGFTESIDRCVKICQEQGWATIRIDGRGWDIRDHQGYTISGVQAISLFQDLSTSYPKVAWVGHPGSGGFGHTLTAASMIVYYSNDFNGNNRSQSEDRIHRIGMDEARGATIVDLIHLPSDRKVRDNLREKRRLELLTMGEIADTLATEGADRD